MIGRVSLFVAVRPSYHNLGVFSRAARLHRAPLDDARRDWEPFAQQRTEPSKPGFRRPAQIRSMPWKAVLVLLEEHAPRDECYYRTWATVPLRELEIATMRMPVTLFMAIGKAALNVAGVGIVGDAAEIRKAAWNLWKKSPDERLDELEAVVGAGDDEVARAAESVVAELAADEPEEIRIKLASFLKQVPSRIRQSQRRPSDPTGRTIRPGLVVGRPEDMIAFIPDQLPLFQRGEKPLAGADWELIELLGIGGSGSPGPPIATARAVGLAATSRGSTHPTAHSHDRDDPTRNARSARSSDGRRLCLSTPTVPSSPAGNPWRSLA